MRAQICEFMEREINVGEDRFKKNIVKYDV